MAIYDMRLWWNLDPSNPDVSKPLFQGKKTILFDSSEEGHTHSALQSPKRDLAVENVVSEKTLSYSTGYPRFTACYFPFVTCYCLLFI